VSTATEDRFLNGRVIVRQTATGFRAGLDAVMLAAAVPAGSNDDALELGAGAGTASLCLAARVGGCSVTGVEIDPMLAGLANANAQANGMALRVAFVAADIFELPKELKRDFAHVLCNPPFHDGGEISPDAGRDRALRDSGRLGDWIEEGVKRTVSNGTTTVIVRADRMNEALARLPERGVSIFPLWPRAGEAARRVILQACKGSRAASSLMAGMVLHNADGSYTPAADRVLRDGAALTITA
jgi:tRNA1Val (adenine37-N6)-methyltransferase